MQNTNGHHCQQSQILQCPKAHPQPGMPQVSPFPERRSDQEVLIHLSPSPPRPHMTSFPLHKSNASLRRNRHCGRTDPSTLLPNVRIDNTDPRVAARSLFTSCQHCHGPTLPIPLTASASATSTAARVSVTILFTAGGDVPSNRNSTSACR